MEHLDTAASHVALAKILKSQGKQQEAVQNLQAAVPGYEVGRASGARSGLDRSLARSDPNSPHQALAVCLARAGRATEAWEHAEASLACGLLDDLDSSASEVPKGGDDRH